MDLMFDALSDGTGPIRLKGSGINTFTTAWGVGMMADLTMWESLKSGKKA